MNVSVVMIKEREVISGVQGMLFMWATGRNASDFTFLLAEVF